MTLLYLDKLLLIGETPMKVNIMFRQYSLLQIFNELM